MPDAIVADPRPLVRIGLRLALTPEFRVIEADSARAAFNGALESWPALVVLSGEGSGSWGLIAALGRELPAARILVVGDAPAGVPSIPESADPLALCAFASALVSGARRPSAPAPEPGRLATLSPRELEVLDALASGRSNRQIAWELGISEGTVKDHLGSILRKLAVRDRTAAAVAALAAGRGR